MLKTGGVLVYSTCTITPKENEEQVMWFLDKFPEFELVEQVSCVHVIILLRFLCANFCIQEPFVGYPGLNLDKVQRFWPCSFCKYIGLTEKPLSDSVGFFIAKFVKTLPCNPQNEAAET